MNLVIGFSVSFFSIFLLCLLGAFINSRKNSNSYDAEESKKIIIKIVVWSVVMSIVYGLLIAFCRWFFVVGVYGPTPFFGWIIVGAVISIIILELITEEAMSYLPAILVIVVLLLWSAAVELFSSDAFNYESKVSLAGKIEIIHNSQSSIEPADVAHLCLVSESMARVSANNALNKIELDNGIVVGSRYEIGSPTKQYVNGQLWWIFPLEFNSYFKWKENPYVPGYLRVSAENPKADAQAVQVNKLGLPIKMKYLNSAYFGNQAERYLRENGSMDEILDDFTFEVDDNWDPYYTVSVLKRTLGYSGYRVKEVLILNIQNGNISVTDPSGVPNWVDRVIPLDIINTNLSAWGEYGNAPSWWYTFFNSDRSQKLTDGWWLVYNRTGHCEWFSGWTSTNGNDYSITGFTLTDARSGKTKFVKTSGITEDKAKETAKSLWSNFSDYETTECAIYNIYGTLTYVIPMEYKGQFKGVSLVSLSNYAINSKGNTLEEALSLYRASMYNASDDKLAPNGGGIKTISLTGTIEQVGLPLQRGTQQIFCFKLKNVDKVFEVSYNVDQPDVPFMKENKVVEITFFDSKEKVITLSSFHIKGFDLSDENPNQARYLKNRIEVNKEIKRIN